MVVYQPASVGGQMQLLELRNSPQDPFLFVAWLDPTTGNSTLINLPGEWYEVRPLCKKL